MGYSSDPGIDLRCSPFQRASRGHYSIELISPEMHEKKLLLVPLFTVHSSVPCFVTLLLFHPIVPCSDSGRMLSYNVSARRSHV